MYSAFRCKQTPGGYESHEVRTTPPISSRASTALSIFSQLFNHLSLTLCHISSTHKIIDFQDHGFSLGRSMGQGFEQSERDGRNCETKVADYI